MRGVECLWDEAALEQITRRPPAPTAGASCHSVDPPASSAAPCSNRADVGDEDEMAQAMALLKQAEQLLNRASERQRSTYQVNAAREMKEAPGESKRSAAERIGRAEGSQPETESEDELEIHAVAPHSTESSSPHVSRRLLKVYHELVKWLPTRGKLNVVLEMYFARLNEGTYVLHQADFQRKLDAKYAHFMFIKEALAASVEQRQLHQPKAPLGFEKALADAPNGEELRLAITVTLLVLRTQLQGFPLELTASGRLSVEQTKQEPPRAVLQLCQRAFTYFDPLEKESTLDDLRLCLLFVGCTCILQGTAKAVMYVVTSTLLCIRHGLHDEPPSDLPPTEIRDRLSLFITTCTFDWIGSASLKAPSLMPFCPEKQPLLFEGYFSHVRLPRTTAAASAVKSAIPMALHPLVLTPRMEFHFQCALVSQLLSAKRWSSPSSVEFELKMRGAQAALHRLALLRDRCVESSQLHGFDLILEEGTMDIVLASLECNAEQRTQHPTSEPRSQVNPSAPMHWQRPCAQIISIFARIVRRMAACHLGLSTTQLRSRFSEQARRDQGGSSETSEAKVADVQGDEEDGDEYMDAIALDVFSQRGMQGLRDLWFCTQVTARALQAHYKCRGESTAGDESEVGRSAHVEMENPNFRRDLCLVEKAVAVLADQKTRGGQGASGVTLPHKGVKLTNSSTLCTPRSMSHSALVLKPFPSLEGFEGSERARSENREAPSTEHGSNWSSSLSLLPIVVNAVSGQSGGLNNVTSTLQHAAPPPRDSGTTMPIPIPLVPIMDRPEPEAGPTTRPVTSAGTDNAQPRSRQSGIQYTAATNYSILDFHTIVDGTTLERDRFTPQAAFLNAGGGPAEQNETLAPHSAMSFDLDLDSFLASTFF